MEELVVSAHEFESFSKWYRYREPVVSGCVQGVSSTRNIHSMEKKVSRGTIRIEYKKRKIPENFYNLQEFCLFLVN